MGIDWASQSHQVCLVAARGECLGERAVAHGGLGIEELCDWLIARTGATPEVTGVAIEMTQGPVVEALLEHEIDFSFRGFGSEVPSLGIDWQRHNTLLSVIIEGSFGSRLAPNSWREVSRPEPGVAAALRVNCQICPHPAKSVSPGSWAR